VLEEFARETRHQPRQASFTWAMAVPVFPLMMHVNQYDGLTIAVTRKPQFITRVAKRTGA